MQKGVCALLAHVRIASWSRPAETDVERVRAALAAFRPDLDAATYIPATHSVSLPKKKYQDTTLDEVFADAMDPSGKTWFVDVAQSVHYHGLTEDVGFNASISVSDDEPDLETGVAPVTPRRRRDPYELTNDVLVRASDGSHVTVTDAASITAHDADGLSHQDVVQYPDGTGSFLTAYGEAILGDRSAERDTYTFRLENLPDPSVLQAGQLIEITSQVMDLDHSTQRIAQLSWETPAPGVWHAELECGSPTRLQYRRRRRPTIHDLTRKTDESRPPAKLCDAGSPLAAVANHAAKAYQNRGVSFAFGSEATPEVMSSVTGNTPWPLCGCWVGTGGFGPGTDTWEAWYQLIDWGAPGDRDVGALIEVAAVPDSSLNGVAHDGIAIVGVAYTDPSALGGFTAIGSVALAAGGSLIVSRSLLAGATYLVVAPAWRALEGFFACAEDLVDGAHGPIVGGEGNSGGSPAPALTVTVQQFCASGRADWVGGDGATDGANATYRLVDWTGSGSVEARVGAMILGVGDFTLNPDAGTVTLTRPPFAQATVAFRYDVEIP